MTTNLVVRGKDTPIEALEKLLGANREQIALVLPENMKPERLMRMAVTALKTSPWLQGCSLLSVANSVMLAAQMGLEPNSGLGHGYLIPYKGTCTFQVGYRGLLELAYRSGELRQGGAKCIIVYDKEPFQYSEGEETTLKHTPLPPTKRGQDWIGCYSKLETTDGFTAVNFMWKEEIEAIRDKCAARDKNGKIVGPWETWFEEMVKKTVLKRHLKLCHLSVQSMIAVGADDQSEAHLANGHQNPNRREVAQDLVLGNTFVEQAISVDDALEGSAEDRDHVKEEKLKKGKKPAAPAQETIKLDQRELTEEENAALDREIRN